MEAELISAHEDCTVKREAMERRNETLIVEVNAATALPNRSPGSGLCLAYDRASGELVCMQLIRCVIEHIHHTLERYRCWN